MNPYATIDELGAMLRSKQTTSVELTKFYLDRLETLGPKLNAVVTITRERAMEEAKRADADFASGNHRGRPLLGIPYGVKDLLATKGIPTTYGAEPYRNQVFDYDATVIERLTKGGAVLVAKLAMVELAGGFGYNNADASFTGPGRTPWNTEFWSGGSSSGPGAAVGAGLVPFAMGSETSGSILTPSSFCGVSGLRPTYGAVSRHGAMALCWTLDKLGPMCRTAADCNTVFGEIIGLDEHDPTTISVKWIASSMHAANKRKARIATVKGTYDLVQPAVRDNFLQSVQVLKSLGHSVSEIEKYPELPYGAVIGVIVDAEGASAFEDVIRDGREKQLRAKADKIGGFEAASTLAVDYIRAQRIRPKIRKALLELFNEHDLIIAPGRSTVAYPIGPNFDEVYKDVRSGPSMIGSMNLLGAPAVALPNGFGDNGLPTSIQMNAAPANETMLMNVAIQLQSATEHHKKTPAGFE
jgi:aspartyl-tRNA(Asn)/glutamyl-tRNA(Gln) amidotransferase subunit A